MNDQQILDELLALLEAKGVLIRSEALAGSGGGLCTVKGRQIFFVDTQAAAADVAVLCAHAITKIADIETLYIRPQIRQFIENNTEQVT